MMKRIVAGAVLAVGLSMGLSQPASAVEVPQANGLVVNPGANGLRVAPEANGLVAPEANGLRAAPEANGLKVSPQANGLKVAPEANGLSALLAQYFSSAAVSPSSIGGRPTGGVCNGKPLPLS